MPPRLKERGSQIGCTFTKEQQDQYLFPALEAYREVHGDEPDTWQILVRWALLCASKNPVAYQPLGKY